MKNNQVRTKEIRVYLSAEEKEILEGRAAATNQKLSGYIHDCLTRRINKMPISPEAIADRVLLSKIKSSVMLLTTITRGSTDLSSRDKLLNELQALTRIVDNTIMVCMGCSEDDSSNLS